MYHKQIVLWVGVNVLVYFIAYLWLFESVKWAESLFVFTVAAYVGPLYIAAVFISTNPATASRLPKAEPSVPLWLNASTTIALSLVIASQGHFLVATGVLIIAILETMLLKRV